MSFGYNASSFYLWCCFLYSITVVSSVRGFVTVDTKNFVSGPSRIQSSLGSSAQKEQETLKLFSPCKINLFLRIIRKREDGFHDLASLFQAIGFGDTLELTPLDEEEMEKSADEFTCNMPGVPVDSTNLVLRALELMREKTGVQMYFRSNLIKQVPAQAGLGGGSANAATAMWGANELMGRPASLEDVRKWRRNDEKDLCLIGVSKYNA